MNNYLVRLGRWVQRKVRLAFSLIWLAQPVTAQEILIPQEIRPLPGKLDSVLVFNSNSPEIVINEGILLSTFPPTTGVEGAHLGLPLQGRFDIFAHHIARPTVSYLGQTLYLGIVVSNPLNQPVTLDVLQAASYQTQPDAPFVELAPLLENLAGAIFSGPGSRLTDDFLRGKRPEDWPDRLTLAPGETTILFNRPLDTPPNGRSTLAHLRSSGPLYVASMARFSASGAPTLTDWLLTLQTGTLVTPRDIAPTDPSQPVGKFIYGRVAGVAQGSTWRGQLSDRPGTEDLTIPRPGERFSYVLNTASLGTLGTGQVQSAPMVVRYPDTAYLAHGNYGIHYQLNLLLYNPRSEPQQITLTHQTPRKPPLDNKQTSLIFVNPPDKQITYRGTVRVRYNDDQNLPQTRYLHLVEQRGQNMEPLVAITLPPGERRAVYVDYIYPPDSTPPQVLTLETLL